MQTNTEYQVYAGFFVRLAAFVVDMVIVNAALLILRIPMWLASFRNSDFILAKDLIFQYSILDIVWYLLTALYFVLFTYYTGATLGKKLFQLRVVSVEDRDMTLFEVAYRETIGRFLAAIVLQLGYLMVIVQKDHRGAHDLLSDTCVIYYHEKKVYIPAQMNYRNIAPQPGYTVPPSLNMPGPDIPQENDIFRTDGYMQSSNAPQTDGDDSKTYDSESVQNMGYESEYKIIEEEKTLPSETNE